MREIMAGPAILLSTIAGVGIGVVAFGDPAGGVLTGFASLVASAIVVSGLVNDEGPSA